MKQASAQGSCEISILGDMQNVPEQGPKKPDLLVKLVLLWAGACTRDLQSFNVPHGIDSGEKNLLKRGAIMVHILQREKPRKK